MSGFSEHLVDPATIKVGQRARFSCPEPNCTFAFFHYWQPADAVTTFGDSHCYLHRAKRVTMFITFVEDIPPNL